MPPALRTAMATAECARGALLALHAASGLAMEGSPREVTRLLRAAEGLVRSAISLLSTTEQKAVPKTEPPSGPPSTPARRRRQRRKAGKGTGLDEGKEDVVMVDGFEDVSANTKEALAVGLPSLGRGLAAVDDAGPRWLAIDAVGSSPTHPMSSSVASAASAIPQAAEVAKKGASSLAAAGSKGGGTLAIGARVRVLRGTHKGFFGVVKHFGEAAHGSVTFVTDAGKEVLASKTEVVVLAPKV